MSEDELIEHLADKEHASWASWMDDLFSTCITQLNAQTLVSEYVIPAWAVERWKRQAATPYADLSEAEKQSDRNEVDKILPIIRAFCNGKAV